MSEQESMREVQETEADGASMAVAPVEEPGRIMVPARWSIAVDVITRGTEGLPEFEREQLRWIGRWGASGNYSLPEVAAMIKKENGECYSRDSLYHALTGRRAEEGVSLRPLAEAISRFRRRMDEATGSGSQFVHTRLSRRLFAMCDRARRKGRLMFVLGDTQVGKTSILSEYQRTHNHGQTYLVRMPTRGSLTHFIAELAAVLHIPTKRREQDLRRRIFDCFDPAILLIVDEAHHCMLANSDTAGMTLEFIRELHDRRKCGVVISGTEVLARGLQQSKLLRQLWERRTASLIARVGRDAYTPADLAEFAKAYGLDPAPTDPVTIRVKAADADGNERQVTYTETPFLLQRRVVMESSLGAWIKILDDGTDWAAAQRRQFSWAHVIHAYCVGKAQEGGAA